MGEYRRGEVVLVKFPFTDLRTTKLRPAVVLGVQGDDLIVVGIFSSIPAVLQDTWLLVEEHDPHLAQTGLRRRSVIKGEKLAVLHRSIVHSTIGSLPPSLLTSLEQRVKRALHLP